MNKEEILSDEFVEREISQPKSHKKIKIAISIVASLIIIATTTLLVGHFKFDWFKSETYKIDANIHRANYQANYFSEKKDMNIKVSFSNGQKDNKKFLINSSFVVILTDRKELGNGDFLNTAFLIILESKLKTDEEELELTKFSINEAIIKELEANPNGSKYPIGIFTFHEDGTLVDIKLPDNMDKYNADSIVELIKDVIPKLTRNRTEDMSKGLEIKERKNKRKKTIVESQGLRAYPTLEGSRYSKIVERDIEDDQITNIRVDSSAFFESEEEDIDDFGPKDFSIVSHSEINSMITKEEKEVAELIEKISKRFNFIPSGKLIENILEKERKEKEKEQVTDVEEEGTSLRNLGFNFNIDKTFNIKSIKVASQTISIKYRIAVKNGQAINQIIIDSNLGSARFGNDGVTAEISKNWSGNKKIFQFVFPPFPAISLNIYAGGSLGFSVKFTNVQKTSLQLSLSGSLTATAEVALGAGDFAKVAAGAKGEIIKASGYATVTSGGVTKGYKISGGKVEAYVTAYVNVPFVGKKKLWDKSCTVFEGWSS